MENHPNQSHATIDSIPNREVDAILEEGIGLVRERSDAVLNAVDDGVYVLDGQGHTIFANAAAVRLLGYTLREMLGRPQHALIHHTYADGSPFPVEECPIYQAAHDGVSQRVGGDVFWRKDGRKLPVDYTSTPIKEGRTVLGAVITFREANEHRHAQGHSSITVTPIGYVSSTLLERTEAPKQGDEGAPDAWLVIEPSFVDAARDLQVGDEILVLTWLDRGDRSVLRVHPRDDERAPLRGVFSTRSQDRPNPVGIHRVTIIEAADPTRLRVRPCEAFDNTPILDIKPVIDAARDR
jgi:tRNA-Thr(GGU) m(6)t(6)A37 methyltransferase TsaA